MSSNSSNNHRSVRVAATETQSLLRSYVHRNGQQYTSIPCVQGLPSFKSACLSSKPVWLIFTWTLIVSVIYAVMLFIAAVLIASSVGLNPFGNSNPLTVPICITQAVLAFTAMLYPLSGFLADIWCGRFKVVMIGLFCLLFSAILSVVIIVWPRFSMGHIHKFLVPFNEAAPLYIIGICLCPFILAGLALYYANFIQLGLDQLMEESSMHLSLFIHWAIWIETLGTAIVTVCAGFMCCENNYNYHAEIAILSVPCFILFSFPFVFVLSCWKRHWFIAHPSQHNPYRTVIKVLTFARTHKWPLRRSAFTYCDDERPSRIDFAKERYGGPFTTEQVEDVKVFFRILGLLLTLGPLFIMDNQSSIWGFTNYLAYTQDFLKS